MHEFAKLPFLERVKLFPNEYQVLIGKDGTAWCALLGINLVEGVGGFGDTISEALRDLASKIEKETRREFHERRGLPADDCTACHNL